MRRNRSIPTCRLLVASLAMLVMVSPAVAQSAPELEAAAAQLKWREIGPTIMSGRVADLAVVDANPSIFYVGTASGGVWKTINNGTTFEPLFTDEETASIGDITLSQMNPNLVWVGTGEPQNRQSSPWGNGAYKSTDAGRTWTHMGLAATKHISRIQIHHSNPDVVYVAAMGHLWGPNEERGVYKTTDGGDTWERVLFVNEFTGAIDLAMDPADPQTLFAAMYQRQRTAWGYNGGGPGSGIYRTTDGGATWVELTEGLPEGDMGRIGLHIYRRDPNLVFAIVQADRGGGFGGGNNPDRKNGVYRSMDRGETWEHLSTTNNRPMYYSQIWIDPNDPERLYTGGSSLYRSSDGGRTFTPDAARGVHLDHHALWIDPANSNHMIMGSDGGVSTTWDRGENWVQYRNLPISQFYEIGVTMGDPYHVCGGLQDNGSWCAPSQTWSNQGIRTRDWYNVGSGDGFFTLFNPADPDVMFAESQGGNMTWVDLRTMERKRIRPLPRPTEDDEDRSYRFNWDAAMVWSVHDPQTVYLGANHLMKSTDRGWTWEEVSPDLSRAIDRTVLEIMGETEDRFMSRNDGQSSYGNITAIAESPLNASLLYVGTDDGNVQVTRDGGANWEDLTDRVRDLPDQTYVTRLVASRFVEGRVYAAFDGHRNNDYNAYVYVSEDYGQRWRPLIEGLPMNSVNAFAEHHRSPNLLFVANEVGVYFSVDRGEQWARLKNNMPTVPVDDIVIHPRDNDLVLGTHGRGIWIMDDIGPLEELSREVMASAAHMFQPRRATLINMYTPQGWTPSEFAADEPPLGARLRYYLRDDLEAATVTETGGGNGAPSGPNGGDTPARAADAMATLTILDAQGQTIRTLEGPGDAGIQEVIWDLRWERPYEPDNQPQQGGGGFFGGGPRGPKVLPGTYQVRLEAAGQVLTTSVDVRNDPRVTISNADLMARQDAMMSAYALAKPVYDAQQAMRRLNEQVGEVRGLLRDRDDVPDELTEEVDSLRETLRELGQDMNDVARGSRVSFSIESANTRPTADELWQLERAWEMAPDVIGRLNTVITDRMPALNRRLNELGIRPDPGDPVPVPRRPME